MLLELEEHSHASYEFRDSMSAIDNNPSMHKSTVKEPTFQRASSQPLQVNLAHCGTPISAPCSLDLPCLVLPEQCNLR
jgi:hypothetical protein